MMEDMVRLTSFDEVFQNKLNKIVKKIQKQLDLPEKERNKKFVKQLLKEAKSLKRLLKDK
jgi:Flp pilus assembly CpaF family ATPase